MIVRTYARRIPRDIGRSFSDPTATLIDADSPEEQQSSQEFLPDFPPSLSQDSFPNPNPTFNAFSSQDSSPWSLDSDPPSELFLRRPGGKKAKNSRRERGAEASAVGPSVSAAPSLMEAQEFGEMMEHVDEVNFALDGLRPGQPARIRRASLLSLLSICGSAQQRRLLRAQGMAKKIIDAILGLNFDDSPTTIAAAALFFVMASDVQDDHLLDSPPCIRFLLNLLNPPTSDTAEDKAPTIGSKLLGIRKPQVLSVTNKGMDSSTGAIISKVQEILLSCKEIKSGNGDDEGMSRPELTSKWITLLTMEKACLSTVSFEDTTETVKAGGSFKERLRELGGLDAVFDVVISCHSTIERWFKNKSPSVSQLKDGVTLKNVVLLLKCLKIMENATFLSKDNQDHLLGMRGKLNSEGLSPSFIGVVISSIEFLSGLSLLQSPSSISNKGKSTRLSENVDARFSHASQGQVKENRRGDDVASDGTEDFHGRTNKTCHARQKLSASLVELSVSGSEMTVTFDSGDLYSVKKKADCRASDLCDGPLRCSNGDSYMNTNGLKVNTNANGLKVNVNATGLKVSAYENSAKVNSGKGSHGWISIRAIGSKKNSHIPPKRQHTSQDVKAECTMDSYDPFAFDEGELEPSKWEKFASKKGTSQTLQSAVSNKKHAKGYDVLSIDAEPKLSHSTNGDSQHSVENNCSSVVEAVEEDSNLLEDCLLTSVKVLMNLTNDNPVGCQQIAACGGLDTMVSLIISHFPSYDSYSPMSSQLKEDIPSSSQSISADHLSSKHLTDHGLDFLVAILGLLVNLVEKDSRNRLRLASARVIGERPGKSEIKENHRDVIPLLCSIFLANQGAGEAAEEGRLLCDDEALMQGEQEAEMMIIEAYAALLLAFLSPGSAEVREAIASRLPNHNLQALVPVLERFVAFHLTLNMISPETHSAVAKVIESCRGP